MPTLLRELKKFYTAHGRDHLPWRKTRRVYNILVSEVMLQQTQVDRVVPLYKRFVRQFPTAKALAEAPLPVVLTAWQGLGYNRRAKFLCEAAGRLVGTRQMSVEFLEGLPGVGPYTARAVAAFAYNRPEVFVETNIRTVFLHHLYKGEAQVHDRELLVQVAEALKKSGMEPREFYAALMDYGAHLKRSGVRLNLRSAHYVKQKKFKGSARELRGAILRELLKGPLTLPRLAKNLSPREQEEVRCELVRLEKEGLVTKGPLYAIAA